MKVINDEIKKQIIEFAQALIRIKSYSGKEEQVIRLIEKKMKTLGFDEVFIDSLGNVIGRIGDGEKIIMFDSHVDTVAVNDAEKWDFPPFGADVSEGFLYGRGSVDMKSAISASIFAASEAKKIGILAGKTIYVSCTVFEEDCDGENLKHLFEETKIKPDALIICEPSNNKITLGHKGKAQVIIKTKGVSAHGAAPEKGRNAVYEMAEIIERVKNLNLKLSKQAGINGTIVLSKISSISASLNAVPTSCEIYLDRRIGPNETEAQVKKEMDELVAGKAATWEVGTLYRKSWTGKEIIYEPFHPSWEIEKTHILTQKCIAAYEATFAKKASFDYWDFSTNAVTPVKLGIPTIGFGPGDYALAHMRNERCVIQEITEAADFYLNLIIMY